MGNEASIEFVRWPYDDESWHIGIRAADAAYRVEQEFYAYPSELVELANRLSDFPVHRADEVRFEVGAKDSSSAHWVLLRVFVVDAAGHAAVTIDVGDNGDELRRRSARFTIGCDVASLNQLGQDLRRWIEKPDASLCTRLRSS